jgi:hypothetical protein
MCILFGGTIEGKSFLRKNKRFRRFLNRILEDRYFFGFELSAPQINPKKNCQADCTMINYSYFSFSGFRNPRHTSSKNFKSFLIDRKYAGQPLALARHLASMRLGVPK